ncbi:MAG: cytochrome c oxidase assembly factor Coa1 family protein [Candidatus Sulfotelmatobacter sp.]
MPTAPYPLHPEPITRSWIEQHPLWKIPLGLLTLLFLIASFGAFTIGIISGSFRNSDVYKQAMVQATANSQVRDQMGEPMKAGWFIFGELKIGATTGRANFSIPISGPHGKGRIRVVAHKNGGWRFTCLQVSVQGQTQIIDVLAVQPPARSF